MQDERIQQLILLQSRDRRLAGAKNELDQMPNSREALQKRIAIESDTLDLTRKSILEVEARCKKIEGDVAEIENRVTRYKTQQLQVKRPEEYKALDKEIASLIEQVSEMEDEQLELLEKIESEQSLLSAAESPLQEKISRLETQLSGLDDRAVFLTEEIDELEQSYKASLEQIPAELLLAYKQVKRVAKRSPWVVPVENQLCGGCNLRVSNDVVAKALVEGQISNCDQCGRIVYFER